MSLSSSDSVRPQECANCPNANLTSSGSFVLQSSVAFPIEAGSPVEREKAIPWEVSAVASMWARCSGVVAAELRGWADEVVGVKPAGSA